MQIDGFTLLAEIVNFLILVWLLQRFLYRPIVSTMEAREQTIENRLREADEKNEHAAAEAERYHTLQTEIEEQRDDLLEQARHEAENRRNDLLEQARAEAQEMRHNWELAIQQEQASFLGQVERRIGESAINTTRRLLVDIAGDDLESRVVGRFIRRLRDADEDTQAEIRAAFEGETIEVDSAFDLPDDQRDVLQETLDELAGESVTLKFRVRPRMLYGIRLSTGDYEISWDISEYTGTLNDQFERLIEEQMRDAAGVSL